VASVDKHRVKSSPRVNRQIIDKIVIGNANEVAATARTNVRVIADVGEVDINSVRKTIDSRVHVEIMTHEHIFQPHVIGAISRVDGQVVLAIVDTSQCTNRPPDGDAVAPRSSENRRVVPNTDSVQIDNIIPITHAYLEVARDNKARIADAITEGQTVIAPVEIDLQIAGHVLEELSGGLTIDRGTVLTCDEESPRNGGSVLERLNDSQFIRATVAGDDEIA